MRPLLLGVVGKDSAATDLRQKLRDRGMAEDAIIADAARRTTVKTRIIAGSQQVVRADWESSDDLAGGVEARALDALAGLVREARAVVLSDYAKGTLTPNIIGRAIELAEERSIPILVDPKLRRYRMYRGVTLLTPNLVEAERFAGLVVQTEDDLEQAASSILKELGCEAVLITRGERGMSLFEAESAPRHIPLPTRSSMSRVPETPSSPRPPWPSPEAPSSLTPPSSPIAPPASSSANWEPQPFYPRS